MKLDILYDQLVLRITLFLHNYNRAVFIPLGDFIGNKLLLCQLSVKIANNPVISRKSEHDGANNTKTMCPWANTRLFFK